MTTAVLRAARFPAGVAAAWALAAAAQIAGGGRLDHDALVAAPLGLATAALFLLAWQAHVAVMMLPASRPMLVMFSRVAAAAPSPRRAVAAFAGGYLAVWGAFGAVAFAADIALHALADGTWVAERPRLVLGGVLVLAGAVQLSDLKQACLRECRAPASFVRRHYRRGARAAFALGARHGAFCVGCCWALMLVVFTVGMTNLILMAPVALVMTLERVAPRGERLVAPLGHALLATGAVFVAASVIGR